MEIALVCARAGLKKRGKPPRKKCRRVAAEAVDFAAASPAPSDRLDTASSSSSFYSFHDDDDVVV
jgi:hypothetical protein